MSESIYSGRSTAESESEKVLFAVCSALGNNNNFKLEAGAGAGKTHTLIQALNYILENKSKYLPRNDQRVACLTYTRVARDEIIVRTDRNPAIFTDTLHGFLWEMISPYQKALWESLQDSEKWKKKLSEKPVMNRLKINYDFGIQKITEEIISLHHDDIPDFAINLLRNEKFRSLVADRFPIIFIDEYQDTPKGLAEEFMRGYENDRISPIIGFFGDHWQQIYDKTCGSIEHSSLTPISKGANFRSDKSIIDFLNKMRPELPQLPREKAGEGTVTIYHSNEWPGKRQAGPWKGQISPEATNACIEWLKSSSPSSAWVQKSKELKVLMLTHASIANEMGYPNLPKVFRYNESFTNKQDSVIEYLVDVVERAIQAFGDKKYGELFQVLGGGKPVLRKPADKKNWFEFFKNLTSIRETGTVGDVLKFITREKLFSIPTSVRLKEYRLREKLNESISEGAPSLSRDLQEYQELLKVPYAQIISLSAYLDENTIFSTQHSVKGAEFDDVIVVLGRGWSRYNFAQMIEEYSQGNSTREQSSTFQRSRNLFYVSASRAKHNLALLFVQELEAEALSVLEEWVGPENIISIEFDEDGNPLSSPVA